MQASAASVSSSFVLASQAGRANKDEADTEDACSPSGRIKWMPDSAHEAKPHILQRE